MKKAILLMAFSIVSFYMGQATACTGASGDRNINTRVTISSSGSSSTNPGTR